MTDTDWTLTAALYGLVGATVVLGGVVFAAVVTPTFATATLGTPAILAAGALFVLELAVGIVYGDRLVAALQRRAGAA